MTRKAQSGDSRERISEAHLTLGTTLVRARGRLTQKQLAELIGWSPTVVSKIENGRYYLTADLLETFFAPAGAQLEQPVGWADDDFYEARQAQVAQFEGARDATPLTVVEDSVECTYRIGPTGLPIDWREKTTLRPIVPRLPSVHRSYLYTGSDDADVHQLVDGGALMGPIHKAATRFRHYDIILDPPPRFDEPFHLHELVTFPKANVRPQPFLTYSIVPPRARCKRASLRLEFDPSFSPTVLFEGEGPIHLLGEFDSKRPVDMAPGQHVFMRTVLNLEPHRCYGFGWEWPD